MYLVEYYGDSADLKPEDDEIAEIKMVPMSEVPSLLAPESAQFFREYVLSERGTGQ
ncbi:hypothetical protein [Marinicrinis lubricantis]|uniref:Nudix hydrolase domain-containing protein n=1 Tax=Marinicrinis lubricantis TaxID=2086470 RepID=A0ABW1IK36_9BACL